MKKLTLALLLVILLLSACANVPATPQANKPVVMVSVQPQAYFVQKSLGIWLKCKQWSVLETTPTLMNLLRSKCAA